MAMNIIVCGDSFMAPDPVAYGKHFSELIGATSLAKPGCSNIDICFQIKEALRRKPDYVIIGTTDSARIELKMSDLPFYDLNLINFRNGEYISDTIPTLIGQEIDLQDKYELDCTRRESVKRYFVDVYDQTLKSITDNWTLKFWYSLLEKTGIKYTVLDKNFCIYNYAREHPNEPYTFHTDFITQEKAAVLLLQ